MADIARLIIRTPNWLGDAVMALPAMAAVRRGFADRTLLIAAPKSIAPIFSETTDVAPDEVLSIDSAREVEQLRAARADAIIVLRNSFGSAWTAKRAGIAERWGYRGSGRGVLLTRGVARPRRLHQVEYYNTLARELGFDVAADARPGLTASDRSLERAAALLIAAGAALDRPLVGFAPGAAYGHAKQWPPERVVQVIAGLAEAGVGAVLVGARDDRDAARAIESTLPKGATVANLVGRTTLGELVGVVARCAAFVSNDSGAMHIAAALGVPLTAIFGPTDERVTAPAGVADVILRPVFCRPCMLRECPIDHRCMKRIDVDSVLHSVMRRLA